VTLVVPYPMNDLGGAVRLLPICCAQKGCWEANGAQAATKTRAWNDARMTAEARLGAVGA
jgi:hypothetical protein